MLAGAELSRDAAPGRYLGTISFPDRGARQVTVTWDGPSGKGFGPLLCPGPLGGDARATHSQRWCLSFLSSVTSLRLAWRSAQSHSGSERR